MQPAGDQLGDGQTSDPREGTSDRRAEYSLALHLSIVALRWVRKDDDVVTPAQPPLPYVGIGTDVHALAAGRPMWIAGLYWPDEPMGPVGHSDGDVVAHAACDALLSASGLGDLGNIFGTADPQWADASGVDLLIEVSRRTRAAGFAIGNIAVQLIGNRPRLRDRRTEAEVTLAEACGAPVRLTATTTDGLGLTGRGDGIAAIATALVIALNDDGLLT